jgi:hypothetical protein
MSKNCTPQFVLGIFMSILADLSYGPRTVAELLWRERSAPLFYRRRYVG